MFVRSIYVLWGGIWLSFMANSPLVGQPAALHNVQEIITRPLEIEEGALWQQRVKLSFPTASEIPVLFVRARVPVGGGGNYVMRVLVDGVPLRDSWLTPRLLNKQPAFDPPGTPYHFYWYRDTSWGNFSYTWFIVYNADPQGNWAGTGQDYDYLFNLEGLVGEREITLGLEHVFVGLATALKVPRAPLLVEKLIVGQLPAAEVRRRQEWVLGSLELKQGEINPFVPEGEKGEQAYELTWSGRPDPGMQVTFEHLQGWRLQYRSGGSVSLAASRAQRLWRPAVGKLCVGQSPKPVAILLRPPQPIKIETPFDAINFWVYGPLHFMNPQAVPMYVSVLLANARGGEMSVDLGAIRMGYWMLLHGYIPPAVRTRWQPLYFCGVMLSADNAKADYTYYLEGLHFYERQRQPRPAGRPEKPVFPVADTGNLPTPPPGVKTSVTPTQVGARFVSRRPEGQLVFEVDVTRGCLEGIQMRWQDKLIIKPCAGGGILAAPSQPPVAGKLLSHRVVGGKLLARWQAEKGRLWRATYSLSGCSLIVDIAAEGSWASGTGFGAIEGLPELHAIEVPYLKMSRFGANGGGMTPIAAGGGLFVSVLPDMYYSDYSYCETGAPQPRQGRLQPFTQTIYTPLTNGQRHPVRDRLLISASPEFAEVLPNHQNPRSPNIERLAPYMFVMDRAFSLNRWETMKNYGLDYVIANDFAGIFVRDYSEGFGLRWRPHPSYRIEQVQQARAKIKSLGYLFGAYIDATDFYPLNEFWEENLIALTPEGDLAEAWPGSYATKSDHMWRLTRRVGQKMKQLYPPDCVYLDVSTNLGAKALDYEAGYPGAGMARACIIGVGDSLVEARRWYGTTISEGIMRWIYAGLSDMDYAQVHMSEGQLPLPLDFDLLKIHPYQIGTMMGYGPSNFLNEEEMKDLHSGAQPAPQAFYKWLSCSLAYGHMAMLGYGFFPPMARMIQHYALMQALQEEYLPDTVTRIEYYDGQKFLPPSQALLSGAYKRGQVRVTYKGGLLLTANLNGEENWQVVQAGREYILPPWGWIATGGRRQILAYSALVEGKRMDYVQSPQYIYAHGGELVRRVGPLEVQGAAWLKRQKDGWLLLPCGHLGYWNAEQRLEKIPPDRGTPLLIVEPGALGMSSIVVEGVGEQGESLPAQTERLPDGRLKFFPSDKIRAYRLIKHPA